MSVSFRKTAICAAIAAFNSGFVISAAAQTSEPSASPTAEATVDDSSDIQEVVVTARRVEERAQDVPISMTVFNQQQLTQHNVVDGAGLAAFTPSLSTNGQFGSEGTSFAMRGFRQEIDTTASVATYFADVVAPRGGNGGASTGDGGGPGNYFDLQNVQVLKGPQGTLFGRNTDGGAVLLVPQKPTSERNGFIDVGYGNYNMFRVTAVGNLPVNDRLRLRFGVEHQSRDGYMKNTTGIGPEDFNDIDYTAARASVVWDITPNLENYTIASFTHSDRNGDAERWLPGCAASSFFANLGVCDQAARDASHGFWTTENDIPFAKTKMQQWQFINTTTWTASDNLTAKNIASYSRLRNTAYNDIFGTATRIPDEAGLVKFYEGLGVPSAYAQGIAAGVSASLSGTPWYDQTNLSAPGKNANDMANITEELQLQGRALSNNLIWQSGLYAEFTVPQTNAGSSSATEISCTDEQKLQCTDVLSELLAPLGVPVGSVGTVNYQVGKTRYHSYGIYEQASYSLTEKFKLTEGLRYTMDSAAANFVEAYYHFPQPNTPELFCNDTTSPYNYTLSGGQNPVPGNNPNPCGVNLKKNSYAPTWLLGLDYKATDNILAYGKYARGYRQGSVSPTGPQGVRSFNPEKVESFELGTKTSFGGPVHGTFNVAAFYNNFRDQQIGEVFFCSSPTCGASPNLGIVNAGRSRIWGAEVESTVSPYKGLTLAVSYAYLNATIVSIQAVQPSAGSPYATSTPAVPAGSEIPLTPKNKYTATLAYQLPLSSHIGKVTTAVNYSYQSGMIQADPANTPYFKTGAFGVTSLNLDWIAIAGSQFDLGLFGSNVFDQRYFTFDPGIYNGLGFESGVVGAPRMYGGHLRFNFGG